MKTEHEMFERKKKQTNLINYSNQIYLDINLMRKYLSKS